MKAAAIREAREEAGIEISPEKLEVVGVTHRKSDDERVDFFIAARSWHGEIANAEPDKCDEPAWYPFGRLPEDLIPCARRALDNCRHGIRFDSFGWDAGGEVRDA